MGYAMRYGWERHDIMEVLKKEEVFNIMDKKMKEYLDETDKLFYQVLMDFDEDNKRKEQEKKEQKRFEEGIILGRYKSLQTLSASLDFEQACQLLQFTDEEIEGYKLWIKK